MVNLNLDTISDKPTRDALESLVKSLNSMTLLKGTWERLEITVVGNKSNIIIPHNLKFTPKDIIVTYQKTSGNIDFQYDKFDRKKIVLSVSGAGINEVTEFKAFIGQYQEG